MGLSVVLANSKDKVGKQITALEWQIGQDTSDKDRKIHMDTLARLKEHHARLT